MLGDPRRIARLAGALWLVVILVSVIGIATQSTQPRLAFAATQFGAVCYLGVTVLLYALFKPVDATLSLFAAVCGAVGLASGGDTSPMGPPSETAFLVEMVFFGCQIFTVGYLITRSTLIPRALGVLLMLGGASYVINSFTNFLAPDAGRQVMPFIVPIAILGEGALTIWLLVKGVRAS
jgi:hypothetical protein